MCAAMMLDAASSQQPRSKNSEPLPLLPADRAWLITLPAQPAAGGAMDESRVYVPLHNGSVVAIDLQTGAIVWTRAVESDWPPVVSDGRVYLAASDALHVLDAVTGESLWQVPLIRLALPMEFDSGLLIAAAETGTVMAVRASDGVIIWRQAFEAPPRSLALSGRVRAICAVFEGGRVNLLSLTDGHQLWERTLTGTLGTPAMARDRVVVGSTDNFFYALDSESGDTAWKWRSGADAMGAAVDGDTVFLVSLDNVVRAVNRGNGNQRWQKATPTRPSGPPHVVGGTVVVPGVSPGITAFDVRNGTIVGTYAATGELRSRPLIDGAARPFGVALVAVFRDGRVEGLRPTRLQFLEPAMTPVTTLPGRAIPRERQPGG